MVKIGIVGTGFVAHKRATVIDCDDRACLTAVTGGTWDETEKFAQRYGAKPVRHWSNLVKDPHIHLVFVCHINQEHGTVVKAALQANKHVVVEYPLALDVSQAKQLIESANQRQLLLHVAHIELLSGNHLTLKAQLKHLGAVYYACYSTLSPKRTRINHWTFQPALFGFPLVGALSRIHRLVDCFGAVERVYCQNHYIDLTAIEGRQANHRGCLCTAQLTFASGPQAEVVYGKGQAVWTATRRLEVFGDQGGVVFDGDQGEHLTAQGAQPLPKNTRQGLFGEDTTRVLDYLMDHRPLYCSAEASLYSLQVAVAAEKSAVTGQSVVIS